MICKNLEEVRENIDRIDKEIVKLIAERSKYVIQAASFKKNNDDIKAPARVEAVINKVRKLAQDDDLNPDIIEKIYREIINCFISLEFKMKEGGK